MGHTKTQVLNTIRSYDLADKPCSTISRADIVEFARQKLDTGVKPQTVANYLSAPQASSPEVKDLRREASNLKEVVAELTLEAWR